MIERFGELRHLHLEISSKCNARCPRCPRNFYGFPYPDDFEEANLTLEQLQQLVPVDTLAGVTEVLVNGNYGDFVMNPQAIEIVTWIRANQPKHSKIIISTNGSARDRKFWAALAGISNVEVWFCLDGLADTHHLYRQDTDFNLILSNAGEFIRNGGYAVWNFTVFDHNQHQVEQARDLARDLGFLQFETRINTRNDGPVYDRQGHKVFAIGSGNPSRLPESVDVEYARRRPDRWLAPGRTQIKCEAAQQKSAYIGAGGAVTPCCYFDLSRPSNSYGHIPLRDAYQDKLLPSIHSLARDQSWFPEVRESWQSQPHLVCKFFCGKEPEHDTCD